MNKLTSLPYELQFEILFNLSHADIINYCLTNKAAAIIATDALFWKQLAGKEGIPESLMTIKTMSPSQRYAELFKFKDCLTTGFDVDKVLTYFLPSDDPAAIYLLNKYSDTINNDLIIELLSLAISMKAKRVLKRLYIIIVSRVQTLTDQEFDELRVIIETLGRMGLIKPLIYLLNGLKALDQNIHCNSLIHLAHYGELKPINKILRSFHYNSMHFNEALDLLIDYRNITLIKYLLERYPGNVENLNRCGFSAVWNQEIAEIFLAYGYSSYTYWLESAILNGPFQFMTWILDNFKFTTDVLNYSLMTAVMCSGLAEIKALVEAGATNLNEVLYIEYMTSSTPEIINYLLDNGANKELTIVNSIAKTISAGSLSNEDIATVKFIIKTGVNLGLLLDLADKLKPKNLSSTVNMVLKRAIGED